MDQPSENIRRCRLWLKAAFWLEFPVVWLGRATAWLMLPLIGVIIFDAISRKFLRKLPFVIETGLYHLMNSPKLQDSEWHMHAVMFLVAMGYAYVYNAHVRLDLFRPRLGAKGRLWVELFGGVLLLLPFLGVLIFYGWHFVMSAWITDEGTSVLIGIGNRWFIKSFLVVGFFLLLFSALSLLIRFAVRLWGPEELAAATNSDAFTRDSHSAFE
tara:strand:+ start:259 stop:897 length:639 start_codon:yes stop_codon:yes gene_type:complete